MEVNKTPENFFRKYQQLIVSIVIILLVGVYYSIKSNNPKPPKKQPQEAQSTSADSKTEGSDSTTTKKQTELPKETSDESVKVTPDANTSSLRITGILKKSDNDSKGNYLIISNNQYLYFRSSRDLSSMIDKKIIATGTGNTTMFRLTDIVLETYAN